MFPKNTGSLDKTIACTERFTNFGFSLKNVVRSFTSSSLFFATYSLTVMSAASSSSGENAFFAASKSINKLSVIRHCVMNKERYVGFNSSLISSIYCSRILSSAYSYPVIIPWSFSGTPSSFSNKSATSSGTVRYSPSSYSFANSRIITTESRISGSVIFESSRHKSAAYAWLIKDCIIV